MRGLIMTGLCAVMMALPVAAQDADNAAVTYDTRVELMGDFVLNVHVAMAGDTDFKQFKLSDTTGTYVGTGDTMSDALKQLKLAYLASGLADHEVPDFVHNVLPRAYGMVIGEEARGEGLDATYRVQLDPFPGMVFVIPAWNEKIGPDSLGEKGVGLFKFLPTTTPHEMLVISVYADEDMADI